MRRCARPFLPVMGPLTRPAVAGRGSEGRGAGHRSDRRRPAQSRHRQLRGFPGWGKRHCGNHLFRKVLLETCVGLGRWLRYSERVCWFGCLHVVCRLSRSRLPCMDGCRGNVHGNKCRARASVRYRRLVELSLASASSRIVFCRRVDPASDSHHHPLVRTTPDRTPDGTPDRAAESRRGGSHQEA